ncbi:MAG: HupE/UreJ family protein, partial [Flavobacteriaceae bacterium]|nr:HupE/UreJ family protein [Flavobacteriaceae bacterium]
FGLIHGFGFARYYNQINDEQELWPLVEFALGIELARVVIVFMILFVGYSLRFFWRINQRDWILVVSSLVLGMTLPMLIENWPF